MIVWYFNVNLRSSILEFCHKLVWKIINNIYIGEREGGGGEFLPDSIHQLMTAPRHARRYHNWRWICTEKLPINSTATDLNEEKR